MKNLDEGTIEALRKVRLRVTKIVLEENYNTFFIRHKILREFPYMCRSHYPHIDVIQGNLLRVTLFNDTDEIGMSICTPIPERVNNERR